ncbi:MAG: Nif3-like dinuclear metal center hexameric protein [Legionella sp.]|nr:Nif3-like dinuclear metal center hexameric protein [Legionella sp.]
MIQCTELASYLQDFLSCNDFTDYAPNGLQIEGSQSIQRICTAVTASRDAINEAVSWKADALFVHHGFFWRGEDQVITGMKHHRIKALLNNNINLFAYHLPLDCHLDIGNNACIAKHLQVHSIKMHKAGSTNNLLWSGTLDQLMKRTELKRLLHEIFQQPAVHIQGHDRPIQHIAWCSGAAQDFMVDAHRLGVDAFISGEISERTFYQAKELEIDYFSCGHHATERFGIQALGNHLVTAFNLEHRFIDSNNPY